MTMADHAHPLSGYTVVDASSGIAGAYCTKLLADGGARIIKVESPEGDPLRHWSASGTPVSPGDDGPLFQYLACSKESVVLDPGDPADLVLARELVAGADAVVWSRGSSLAEHPTMDPRRMHERAPHLIVAAITPFGLDGPWAERAATEFTLQAWSGGIWERGDPDRAPLYVGGQQGEWSAGVFAALALLASLRAREDGRGDLVDVSMLESLNLWLFGYAPVTYNDVAARPLRQGRTVNIPGVERTKDGWVGLMCGTAQQWFDFCVMVEHPEWMEEESLLLVTTRADQAERLRSAITEWTSVRTTAEICELATAFRIPNAPVANGASLPTLEHFAATGAFTENPRNGFLQPAVPYRIGGVTPRPLEPAPRLGEHNACHRVPGRPPRETRVPNSDRATEVPLPFTGIRVLDFTALFAGPAATRWLAMLGAEVIHVESVTRLDLFRLYTAKTFGDDNWWEWSPGFGSTNTNKQGVTVDLQTGAGRDVIRRLVRTADVLVENYSPRVMDNLGLDYETVRELRPDAVFVRMPGFGLSGPWRDVPTFAPIIEDASGITWMTGYPDDKPQEAQSVCDPNASCHAAFALMLALENRRRTGRGALVEASMIGAAINISAEQVVEYCANGRLLMRDGNRGPTAAPQGLYLSDDRDESGRRDSWVAIAVAEDSHWRALRAAMGEPDWAMAPELEAAPGRRAAHDLIDDHLSAWCERRSSGEIVDTLWSAGVPVAKVMPPIDVADLDQMQSRGFFEPLDHPFMGSARYDSFPARFSRGPERFNRRPAPLLGQDNWDILTELGFDEDDIAELERQGVIGTAPTN